MRSLPSPCKSFIVVASATLFFSASFPALSQSTWSGGGDGTSWGDASNWTGGVPVASTSIRLGNSPGDEEQTINLGGTRILSNDIQLNSTGNRDYTFTGGVLDLLKTSSDFKIVSGTGNTTATFDTNMTISTIGSGNTFLEVSGTGARTINFNGAITTGSGAGTKGIKLNAENVRLNLRGDNQMNAVYLSQGEVVVYHENAFGHAQIQGGGTTGTVYLSLASDLNLGSTSTSTFLAGNINVRIREETESSTDRVINFDTRISVNTTAGGENGKITVVENINSTGRVILNVKNSSGSNTHNIPIDLGTNGILRFSNTAANIYGVFSTGSGIISGGGDVQMAGTGMTTLTSLNSYTGITSVTSGTLTATTLANGGSNSSIGAASSTASNLILNGGVLRYTGGETSSDRLFTLGAIGGTLDASGSGALAFTNTGTVGLAGSGARTLVLTGSGSGALSAVLGNGSGGATSLTKSGSGTWVLAGANSYTGATTISTGTLSVSSLANGGNNSGIGASSNDAANLAFGSGGVLRYTGGEVSTDRLFTIGTGQSTIDSSGSGALHFTNSGALAYVGSGARTLALTGDNTGRNSIAATIGNSPISGNTSLIKSGNGTWVLSAANSYTGSTTISGGILSIGVLVNASSNSGIGNSSATASNLTFDGGSLQYTGGATSTNRLFRLTERGGEIIADGTGAVNFTSTGSTTFTGNGDRTLSLSGTNTGDNTFRTVLGDATVGKTNLSKNGSGTWILSGVNTYTGGTTVSDGILKLSGSNRLSTIGDITVSGGTLDLGEAGQATSGTVTLSGGTISNGKLTLSGGAFDARAGTLSASLVGDVGLTKTTSSTVSLSGSHAYTGATLISAGKLLVDGNIAASSGVSVAEGATLGGHGVVSEISGAGTVSVGNSPGILTADSVDGSGGLSFVFELTTAEPNYLNAASSGNDLLRLTGDTPFAFNLTGTNSIVIDLSNATVNMGDTFLGGFYVDQEDFRSFIELANFQFIGNQGYTVNFDVIKKDVNFGGGIVEGYITQFTVVPEPGSVALFGFSALGFGWMAFRKRFNR